MLRIHVPIVVEDLELYEDTGGMPAYATPQSCALDLRSPIDFELLPGKQITVDMRIRVATPESAAMLLLPRSGKGAEGLVPGNLVGLIDSDYTGKILFIAWNRGQNRIIASRGDRVCQVMFVPCYRATLPSCL